MVQKISMLGHAGWSSGQLEKEIENGDWLMQSTSIDFVFNTEESSNEKSTARSFGVELSGNFQFWWIGLIHNYII